MMADTDAMGIVYHATYLRWFELGRAELVRATGMPYREMEAMGFGLPVVEARLRYRAPARYDDVIAVDARIEKLGRASVTFEYRLTRDGDGALLCEGETHHACTDRAGRIARFPQSVYAALERAAAQGAEPLPDV